MHPAIKGIIFRQDNLSKQTGGEIIFPKFGADDPKNRLFSRRNDQITHFRRTRRDFCRVRLLFVRPVVLPVDFHPHMHYNRDSRRAKPANPEYSEQGNEVEDFADTECVAKSGQRVRRHMLDGLDIYIRLLEQYQIRATMFAVCRTALRERERVQRYVDRGHRLALHGLEHVPPCGMDDEHFRRATLAGKQQLEAAFHTQVSGYRAPCFGLDEEKLDIVRQLGFRYDSSANRITMCFICIRLSFRGSISRSLRD